MTKEELDEIYSYFFRVKEQTSYLLSNGDKNYCYFYVEPDIERGASYTEVVISTETCYTSIRGCLSEVFDKIYKLVI